MEIAIIKRETTGSGPNTFHENETIAKYEIMDGAPVRGESIPIRVFLAGYDLTPTMRDINKKFSVRSVVEVSIVNLTGTLRYYLNLVLVDEEERRYFKQQEITLWRKGERMRKLPLAGALYQQQQHALARHTGGDLPTQGVRTAPTPSQPPTPYAEGEKPLPGVEESQEASGEGEGEGEENKVEEVAEEIKEKCVVSPASSDVMTTNPPDLVSQVPAASSSSPQPEEKAETDSLADLDIVAVSADMREPPDMETPELDTPPEMPDTPEDSHDSPDISLPDAPSSEPSSPELKVNILIV